MSILVVLAVILGLAAIAVTILKPIKSAQAIRALGVIAIMSAVQDSYFWIAIVAVAWAIIEYAMASGMIKTGKPTKKK